MIKMLKGTYGLKINGVVEAMTSHSAPFSIAKEKEAELVQLGFAKYVYEKEYTELKVAELREIAKEKEIDISEAKNKKEIIDILEKKGIKDGIQRTDSE